MAKGEPVCVWQASALLGEGPVWLPEEDALYWVDIKAPAAHRFVPAIGGRQSWPMPEEIGFLIPRAGGGFIAGLQSGFAFVDLSSGVIEHFASPEADLSNNRLNDGKCDPLGRLWAGSMDNDQAAPTGVLYRVDADRSWQPMDDGYIVTNGPAFSPDGRTLYHTDSFARTIYAFDLDENGALSGKRTHIRIADDQGYPDGMTVDEDGYLWVAHWGGWCLTRFSPEGTVERTIELPVAQVTSCAFGGSDLDTLYVTTAAIGLDQNDRARQPLAGGLFEISVGIKGLPANRFAG